MEDLEAGLEGTLAALLGADEKPAGDANEAWVQGWARAAELVTGEYPMRQEDVAELARTTVAASHEAAGDGQSWWQGLSAGLAAAGRPNA